MSVLKTTGVYLGASRAKNGEAVPQYILHKAANRHGLITGATGTGKTVTMQVMAEGFSRAGIPVFVSDIKGDFSGISVAAQESSALKTRAADAGMAHEYLGESAPVTFWDIFGKNGHYLRMTVSSLGPVLMARLLGLNSAQKGALYVAFKIAETRGLPMITLADLQTALTITDRAPAGGEKYGNVSGASISAIQRQILILEMQGADSIFGQPAFDVMDLVATDEYGRGIVNIMDAESIMQSPRLYSMLLLWMLSDLFERLPEVGNQAKPKLVFFFDEAHLLFDEPSKALMQKIEQIVRMIRSKGVGIYFVTQEPQDIPDSILSQLGNRVQHALRAYTPKALRSIRVAAETFRQNPDIDTEQAIASLTTGEALVSTLDAKGIPGMVQRTTIRPPSSKIGPISDDQRNRIIEANIFAKKYAPRPKAIAAVASRMEISPCNLASGVADYAYRPHGTPTVYKTIYKEGENGATEFFSVEIIKTDWRTVSGRVGGTATVGPWNRPKTLAIGGAAAMEMARLATLQADDAIAAKRANGYRE